MTATLRVRMVNGSLVYTGPYYLAMARLESVFNSPDYRGFTITMRKSHA